MAHQRSKGRYHPSRVSDRAKKERERLQNELSKKPKRSLNKIDISKSDWSIKSQTQ